MSYNSTSTPFSYSTGSPFITAYSPKLSVSIEFPLNSPYTDQSFRDEADINTIMARYQSTGEMPVITKANGQFLDVVGMDFAAHMDQINEARELFGQLPSNLRARFDNDPGAFLDYCSDPVNRPEMLSLGLLDASPSKPTASPAKDAPAASDNDTE